MPTLTPTSRSAYVPNRSPRFGALTGADQVLNSAFLTQSGSIYSGTTINPSVAVSAVDKLVYELLTQAKNDGEPRSDLFRLVDGVMRIAKWLDRHRTGMSTVVSLTQEGSVVITLITSPGCSEDFTLYIDEEEQTQELIYNQFEGTKDLLNLYGTLTEVLQQIEA